MADEPVRTQPVSDSTKLLRDKFYEQYANQSEQMDTLARRLISIELAIPGLYATVLKLTQGDKATVTVDGWLYFTFGCWFLALAFTLAALFPRSWQVDPTIIKSDPTGKGDKLSLEDFFYKSARYKYWLLVIACLFFGAGIVGAVVVLL
ncbi:MAG TPA: hypothetical protein EYP41_12205 [Anaerolineae bacterium]|nr:hypothetical protein [Anaerolineae bacterium]HIP69938.1 hypothetical protein [Anaerolineae bacterium]